MKFFRNPKSIIKLSIYILTPITIFVSVMKFNKLVGIGLLMAYAFYLSYSVAPFVYIFLGNISFMRHKLEKAKKWYGKAYTTKRVKPQVVISYAYLLLKLGEVDECEKVIGEVLGQKLESNDNMLAKSNLAIVYWKKDRLSDAIWTMEELFRECKTTSVYATLGYFLILKGDMEKALKFNLKAYEHDKTDPTILDNLGETYYNLERYNKAEEIYEVLMEKKPVFAEAYYHYALVLMKKEKYEKALEFIKQAFRYQITFLSVVTEEQIVATMNEIEGIIQKEANNASNNEVNEK